MPAPLLIPVAVELAKYAPSILKWLTGSDKVEEVATKVVDIAKQVTGTSSSEDALEQLKLNPELAIQFRTSVMQNETELDKLYLADRQSARDRDAKFIDAGRRNYRADTMYVLAVLVVVCLTYAVWKQSAIDEFAKATVTLILGRFLGYLDTIYQFEFGTTRSSKTKDEAIRNLSQT